MAQGSQMFRQGQMSFYSWPLLAIRQNAGLRQLSRSYYHLFYTVYGYSVYLFRAAIGRLLIKINFFQSNVLYPHPRLVLWWMASVVNDVLVVSLWNFIALLHVISLLKPYYLIIVYVLL